jgi:hypothetical protein
MFFLNSTYASQLLDEHLDPILIARERGAIQSHYVVQGLVTAGRTDFRA